MKRNTSINVGAKFGKLVVVAQAPNHSTGNNRMFSCKCACGKVTVVSASSLKSGKTRSCGCLRLTATANGAKASITHGLRRAPEYRVWQAMLNRCRNSTVTAFKYYGARGIKVCDRWHAFESFYVDMGPRPEGTSLERIDVNGNYEPTNCKWGTTKEQTRNTRKTVRITWRGVTKSARDWDDELGFPPNVVYNRVVSGWDTYRIMTEPYHAEKRRKALTSCKQVL